MNESVYGSSWYAATVAPAPQRDRLAHDLDVDVCVIGGGLAGLTTARELARRGWSVVIVEKRQVAWDASGRNAGFCAPGFAERPERIIERVGLDRARALWVLSAGGVDYVRTIIRETQMPGVSPVDGWLQVQRINHQQRMVAYAELLAGAFGTEVEVWPTEQVRDVLRSEVYFQGLHIPGGFHLHALNYALGLAAAAEEAGVRICEETPALEIDPSGVRKRVTTPAARIRAGHVVLAGSAQLAPLFPMVSGAVLPVVGYVATTAPLGERLHDAIAYAGAVVDSRRIGDHYRIVDGDRLMWGGRLASPSLARLRGTAGEEPPRRVAKLTRRDIAAAYPQLGEVEISHCWSGVMGYAVHRMPIIGEVSPGLWIATAFGGHGLNTSAMAGELIARAIVEGDDRWRHFSSYDLVFAGGGIGRAAAPVLYWFMRVRDGLDERLAWRRDSARQRKEALAAQVAEEARRRVAAQAAQLAAEQAERRSAAEAEQRATMQAVRRAAEEADHLADQEAELRAADDSAQKAALLAAEEAQREEAERAAQAGRWAAQERAQRAEEAARRAEEAAEAAARAAEAEARAAARAAERPAVEQAAARARKRRPAEVENARIAAEEAAQRIAEEAARLSASAQRLAEDAVSRESEPERPPGDETPLTPRQPSTSGAKRRERRPRRTVESP
jgi:glycine/D-amino acid oxidase-like deaminating enzyme